MSNTSHNPEFPSTQWSLLGRLREGSETVAAMAAEEIFRRYRYPLYCFARRSGLGPQDAEDVLHDFLLRLHERGSLKQADATRGRLRSYLMTSLKHAITNWHHQRHTLRRGGAIEHVSLQDEGAEEARYAEENTADSPERLYERKWALALLRTAMDRLRADYEDSGKADLFAALSPVLMEDGTGHGQNLAAKAAALGMNDGALRVALHRMKGRYRDMLMQEAMQTADDSDDARAELGHLLSVFQG